MDDVAGVAKHIKSTIPELKQYPGGYPEAISLALIDAVLSIRAQYGSPTTGVRAAVQRFKANYPDGGDDLTVLAGINPTDLAALVKNQKSGGRLKAECIVDAARAFTALDPPVRTASDFRSSEHDPAELKRAYTGVKGLGSQTFAYFGMLLGRQDVKADVWVQRFVEDALGRAPKSEEARSLVNQAAAKLEYNATHLDHSIWAYQRSATPRPEQVETTHEGYTDEGEAPSEGTAE